MNTSKPAVFFDIQGIIHHSPSKITTHYHLTKKAYVSFDRDTHLCYVWCFSNQEWIETAWTYCEFGLISLTEMQEQRFSSMVIPRKKDHCTLCEGQLLAHVNDNGSLSIECPHCGLDAPVSTQKELNAYFS
ncbi:hypothetical protein JCM19233_4177 [Vibrio astriarenae]|nr:hypothetical protein JCM19233_4177 [Vibrio sp. C7]